VNRFPLRSLVAVVLVDQPLRISPAVLQKILSLKVTRQRWDTMMDIGQYVLVYGMPFTYISLRTSLLRRRFKSISSPPLRNRFSRRRYLMSDGIQGTLGSDIRLYLCHLDLAVALDGLSYQISCPLVGDLLVCY
jgi:hypothetical protein